MLKKILILVFFGAIIFSVSACGENMTIHEPSALGDDDIAIDVDTGFKYAKNQLLLFFRKVVTHEKAMEFIESVVDADVLGYMESIGVYTVKLRSHVDSVAELYLLGDTLTAQYGDILTGIDINRIEEGILVDREH